MSKVNLKELDTEKYNPNSKNIELLDTYEILKKINDEDKKVAIIIEKSLNAISKTIDTIVDYINDKTRIIYVGSGTSGRLGILDASECPPTYGVDFEFIQGIIAGGNEAIFKAKENAEDNEEQGIKDLQEINITKNDIVIGLAASGRTPYVCSALKYAREIGALTASISCSENSKLSQITEYPIEIVVGAEIISGSTRMKAGTAQKMVLNMISTTIMIKKGKIFSGYMIDVKPTNEKLVERAKKIIEKVTGCDSEESEKYFELSNKNVKKAITMILLKTDDLEKIEKMVEKYNGNISRLIHEHIN